MVKLKEITFPVKPQIMPRAREIRDIEIGQTVYTVIWMLYSDCNDDIWLKGDSPYDMEPGGSMQMKVTRDRNGFFVSYSSITIHTEGWQHLDSIGIGENQIPANNDIKIKGWIE
jgi:hypothetical protein